MDKENVVYTYNGILFQFFFILPTWDKIRDNVMNLEGIVLREIKLAQKDKQIMVVRG
jgi:hypothetical protein